MIQTESSLRARRRSVTSLLKTLSCLCSVVVGLSLTSCLQMYDLEVTNNYPFKIAVKQISILDGGKEETWVMGTVEAHSRKLFEAIFRTGEPIFHIQILDSNNKVIEDVERDGDAVRATIHDNKWQFSTKAN